MSEQNKTNVRRLFDEVWNKGHVQVVDELVCYLHMTLVPNFFEQTTDISFVLFRHDESPFLNADFLLAYSELGLSNLG